MGVGDKIISFWKQVRLMSSDMFTLFKVGIGIKSPTHKLHVKDTADPIKIEGLQNDTTDPDKYLTLDSNNVVKYRTGAEVASDIGAVSSFVLEDGDGTEVTVTNGSEIKFVETPGIDIDWTDTSDGSDTDPYDLTFTVNPAQTTITSLFATDIKMGEDDETKIDFGTTNTIQFYTNNSLHTQMFDNGQIANVDTFQLSSATSSSPTILLLSTSSSSSTGNLQFNKNRADDSPANGDDIGNISFVGKDSDDNSTFYGYIKSEISEVTSGSEGGKLTFQVASHDGELANGLVIEDGNAEDEVDVTIGNTATSETTIAGTLTMGSTPFVDNSGVVQVATQGTIDHDSLANFEAAEHYRWDNDIQSTATINHVNLSSDTGADGEVLVINDGDAVWGNPEKSYIQVKNDEGATIPAGTPLYSKGEIGGSNRILVGVADSDDAAKMPCIGIAVADMNTSSTQNGFAITQGVYNTNLTGYTGLSVGDIMYVSTIGTLATLKPTGETGLIQNVGIVLKTDGTICQGLLVSCIGRTNDVPNLDQNALFIGNASNQAVATDAPMVGVITAADAGAARTVLGVDAAGTDNSTNVTLAGTPDYITISGQEITRNAIDLTADVTGTLPVGNGGTGATTFQVDGILTGNGTSAVIAEQYFTYGSEILSLGDPDAGEATITRYNGAGTNGGDLLIQSGRASVGTNLTGGNLKLRGGPGTGSGASGDIIFEAGVPQGSGSGAQPTQEIATLDSTGNLSIDGDLTVKGNDIKDDDGTTCITFDSSGNTTISNTLNASVTGDVTGNVSGSSGSCTGNSATATALTAGNKTLDGNLTIGSNGAGHDLKLYGDTSLASVLWDSTYDFLKFSDLTKIVFGSGVAAGDFDSSIQADGSNLVIYNDTGNIQIGDTVEITGDLTVSGDLSIGNDAEITSVGSMVFRIDSDNNESSQTFTWKDNASDTIAALDENGEFTVYGGSLGDPHITLHQTGNNVTYGPPLLDFYREDTLVDNADIGMVRFIAKDSADNDQTYAQIVGGSEESGSTTEGGTIKLQVATHDGEMQTGVLIEDGNAEDEIDVTIANGSDSLTTVSGKLAVGGDLTGVTNFIDVKTAAYWSSSTSAIYVPISGSTTSESTSLSTASYTTMFVVPFDGKVTRITSWNQGTASPATSTFELYINGDDDPLSDQVGTDLVLTSYNNSMVGDCASDWVFTKGQTIAIRRTDSNALYGVTMSVVLEYDTTT